MPVPSAITDLSQTAASNYPSGSDSPTVLDDVQRAQASFIAQLRDGKGHSAPVTLASAATTDIGAQNSLFVEISGTTTITSFGTTYNGPRFLRFTGALTLTHSANLYLPGAANIVTVAGDLCVAVPNSGSTGWNVYLYQRALEKPENWAATEYTTTGSAGAYVLTPNVPLASLTTGTRYRVVASFSTSGACTLAVSGLTATAIKQYTSAGAKTDPTIVSGQIFDIEYDGTHWVVLDPLPAALTRVYPAVRQTVLSGPVDSNGLPNFGGSTGSTTVTASGTLVATAANGADSSGNLDYVGSITNPSWTSLSTNGTMYLYLDVASNGTCTTGSTTLAPVYQWGGTYSTTNNQFTFNIQAMSGQVGNGATAAQTYRVFVGEVTVSGGVVTAITWYALMGRYTAAWTSTLPSTSTTTTATHNIGVANIASSAQFKPIADLEIECITADAGASVGDVVTNPVTSVGAGVVIPLKPIVSANTAYFKTGSSSAFIITNAGAAAVLTAANWKYRVLVNRGW